MISIFAGKSPGAASEGEAVAAGAGVAGTVGAVVSVAAPPLDSAAIADEALTSLTRS